jgi:tRNA pseudouridine38-40 synthase
MTAPISAAGRSSPVNPPSRANCRPRWAASPGETPLPQGSGRTDAGVHALGQVASFALQAPFRRKTCSAPSTGRLPASIRILEARTVRLLPRPAFGRGQDLRIPRLPRDDLPPFLDRYVLACPWPMDLEALQKAAKLFEGEHDFLSFAATDPDLASRGISIDSRARPDRRGDPIRLQSAIRTVFSSGWEQQQSEAGGIFWSIACGGTDFCTTWSATWWEPCWTCGRGKRRAEEIPAILAARSRSAAGPTAPARGLFSAFGRVRRGAFNHRPYRVFLFSLNKDYI